MYEYAYNSFFPVVRFLSCASVGNETYLLGQAKCALPPPPTKKNVLHVSLTMGFFVGGFVVVCERDRIGNLENKIEYCKVRFWSGGCSLLAKSR